MSLSTKGLNCSINQQSMFVCVSDAERRRVHKRADVKSGWKKYSFERQVDQFTWEDQRRLNEFPKVDVLKLLFENCGRNGWENQRKVWRRNLLSHQYRISIYTYLTRAEINVWTVSIRSEAGCFCLFTSVIWRHWWKQFARKDLYSTILATLFGNRES